MIRSTHINKELRDLTKVASNEKVDNVKVLQAILKALTLLIKVVRDIRTNQVEVMKHEKIELKKDTRPEQESTASVTIPNEVKDEEK